MVMLDILLSSGSAWKQFILHESEDVLLALAISSTAACIHTKFSENEFGYNERKIRLMMLCPINKKYLLTLINNSNTKKKKDIFEQHPHYDLSDFIQIFYYISDFWNGFLYYYFYCIER